MFNTRAARAARPSEGAELVDGHGQSAIRRAADVTLMLSLDPATVGEQGYSHIFQIGETFEGNALIDHQHPHDFLMQAAAVWRSRSRKGSR
jgi:hypothetical protein